MLCFSHIWSYMYIAIVIALVILEQPAAATPPTLSPDLTVSGDYSSVYNTLLWYVTPKPDMCMLYPTSQLLHVRYNYVL